MSLFHLPLSEDVNDFVLVLLIVNCACLNVHLASLIVDMQGNFEVESGKMLLFVR